MSVLASLQQLKTFLGDVSCLTKIAAYRAKDTASEPAATREEHNADTISAIHYIQQVLEPQTALRTLCLYR
jgi:hypothetical protein